MPSVQEAKSKNAVAVQEKHLDLVKKYQDHYASVEQLQNAAKGHVLDDIAEELQLNEEGKARINAYLDDFSNIFRFYRRARYDKQQAITLLNATLLWRIRTDLDLLSLSSLHPLYVTPPPPNPPLFWVNSKFKDFFGRPCGIISLRSVERTAENSLDELKEYIVACMEIMRRYVGDLYRSSDRVDDVVLQTAIAVDLAGSGMANLELELLPFLLDLLKNHMPGMVGAVYILNYGWVHAGMWAVIKRVLPKQALAKIFFLSYDELKEHFEITRIPRSYGGELDVGIDSTSNDVLRRYGRPRRTSSAAHIDSPDASRSHTRMSRSSSFESIYDVFYSADTTPWASRSMTPRHSEPSTPRGDQPASSNSFKMTPTAARKLKHLQMSRGDLSSAAEHSQDPGTRAAGRPHSNSDLRIVDGRAIGLSVDVARSPFATPSATPSMTPVGQLSPRTPRSRNTERHVRFHSPRNRSASPPRRTGASSSFTLYLNERDEESVLRSESEDSDDSGKDGEKLVSATSGASNSILSRLRRLSETRLSNTRMLSGKQDEAHTGSQQEKEDGTIMYIEPGSPQLQVPNLEEPPLQTLPHTFLSHRTRRADRDGHVSPYNANNPFFGYPAYVSDSTEGTFKLTYDTTPKHLHVRRRKRDLLRTLTYLFVLRILALHRQVRWRIALVWREVAGALRVTDNKNKDGDEFWRDLDARRISASPRSKDKKAKVGTFACLSTALLFILVLRPRWRRRLVAQVSMTLAPLMLLANFKGSDTHEEVDWKQWERQEATSIPAVVSKPTSWTGLHVRERLGLKNGPVDAEVTRAAGRAGGDRRARGQRYNPMAIAGGVVAAASLGYLLYNYLLRSNDQKEEDGDLGQRPTKPSSKSATSRFRPSLSVCVSTSFDRSAGSMSDLRSLLRLLAPAFIVHLILPGREDEDLAASIASLAAQLSDIENFDTRRILEYTQPSGRFALSRALACDCHVEIALPASTEDTTATELDKIRRSCGLVVFTCLGPNNSAKNVFEQLKRSARESGSDRDAPNGMRAFDLSETQNPWHELGLRLTALREGWK